MNKSLFAKIFGWAQFGLQTVGQVATSGSVPHGWVGWLTTLASLATAVAVHGASNTGGSKGGTTNQD